MGDWFVPIIGLVGVLIGVGIKNFDIGEKKQKSISYWFLKNGLRGTPRCILLVYEIIMGDQTA